MEYIKYIMLIIILFGSTSLGFLIAKRYTDRLNELTQFLNLINILKNKIKFTHKPLAEIFLEISKIGEKNAISEFFLKVSQRLKLESTEIAWNNAIAEKRNLNLNKEDIKVIKTLGSVLGKSDIDGQISEIEQFSTLILAQIKNAEDQINKNVRMYRSMGTIIGIAIVILLI